MKSCINRNILKIIACISMLIDHIGMLFFPDFIFLRIVGRLAFPIFAYFIAEGFFYTRNKYKYLLLLFIFACVSQIPYGLLIDTFKLNTLFTFVLSVAIILLIDYAKQGDVFSKICFGLLIGVIGTLILFLDLLNIVDYGIIGVAIPVCLWLCKSNTFWRYLVFTVLLIALGFYNTIRKMTISFNNIIQLFALLSIPLLLLYNGQKGNIKLKYLFYTFYPIHLIFLYLITLII